MSIDQFIDNEVKGNEVVLFMKGTPTFPQCGFCGGDRDLDPRPSGRPIDSVNMLEDADLRQGMKDFSNWPTIPQLYVKGEFLGGCDITREMFQSGELKTLFDEKGVATKAPATA